jgi:hypothetical protein
VHKANWLYFEYKIQGTHRVLDIANRIQRQASWNSSTDLDPYSEGVHFEFRGIMGILDEILLGFPRFLQVTAGIVPQLGHGSVFPSSFLSHHSCISAVRRYAA